MEALVLHLANPELASEPAWSSPVSSAAVLLSVAPYETAFGKEGGEQLVARCRESVSKAFELERGFDETVPQAGWSLVALAINRTETLEALAVKMKAEQWRYHEHLGDFVQTKGALRSIHRSVGPNMLVTQMPWLGLAEIGAANEALGGGMPQWEVPLPAAPGLRQVRTQVWEHQLRSDVLPAERQDFAGAIVFTTTKQPLPTWQAARPLAFIATMLGDPRLTEEKEVPAELARLLASLRFLRQLTADEAECHMYKDPAKAIGGVRNSLFDQRMPPEATAMTLLTVCETLRSLDAIKQRQDAGKKAGAGAPEDPQKATPK